MRKITSILIFFFIAINCYSQENTLPSVLVKTLEGNSFNIQNISNKNNPIVISFWATWCKPCKKELNNIAEVYEDWQNETGVKLVAVSIDDTRSMNKVSPFVNASDWEYDILLDPNRDLARALGVTSVPHTFLLDGSRRIVWDHKGYVEGDEDELFEKVKKLID